MTRIAVPTLILTPEEDCIIGKESASALLQGIRRSREVVLARTGHMFRFSHPTLDAREVLRFPDCDVQVRRAPHVLAS